MRCDLHVHTVHSGMCTLPVLRAVCRESYSPPEAVYERLKRMGMDLVTITDHDSVGTSECLRKYPDFFLSEEVTCVLPSDNLLHVGVYDISERDHLALQARRSDVPALAAYLREKRLFYTVNHPFSALTGKRALPDFDLMEDLFPGVETLNAHMREPVNLQARWLACRTRKAMIAGSDAHTLPSLGKAYCEVPGARNKAEFMAAVRRGKARLRGESGTYWKLTRDIFLIAGAMMREKPWKAVLAPLAVAIPVVTLFNQLTESLFAAYWMSRLGSPREPLTWPGFDSDGALSA